MSRPLVNLTATAPAEWCSACGYRYLIDPTLSLGCLKHQPAQVAAA